MTLWVRSQDDHLFSFINNDIHLRRKSDDLNDDQRAIFNNNIILGIYPNEEMAMEVISLLISHINSSSNRDKVFIMPSDGVINEEKKQ